MRIFRLSRSRIGTVLHSLFYLLGIPTYFLFEQEEYNGVDIDHTSPQDYHEDIFNASDFFGERCFGTWGCFRAKYAKERGVLMFPESIDVMKPTVCVYRYRNCEKCTVLDVDHVNGSLYIWDHLKQWLNTRTKSYWIVHGYMDNGNRPFVKEMACELFSADPSYAIFVLDWSLGAKPPYAQAVVNIEVVAQYLATVVRQLDEFTSVKISNARIIGHSLGCHLAGFVGSYMRDTWNISLGQITGLDPAQPQFLGLPEDARLDLTDANFVDVIHSDARPLMEGGSVGGLGMQIPLGHLDFYPNGGKFQPGCRTGVYSAIKQEDGSFLYGIRRFLGCDHMRAYEYFIESIRSTCPFTAFPCDSWEHFLSGECFEQSREYRNQSNRMGFHSQKISNDPQSLYLLTGGKSPFCRDHYFIKIKLGEEISSRITFDMHMVLQSGEGLNASEILLAFDWLELKGLPLNKTFVREGQKIDGAISKVLLRPAMSNPILWFVNRMAPNASPDLVIDSVTIQLLSDENYANTMTFCPELDQGSFSVSDAHPNISLITC